MKTALFIVLAWLLSASCVWSLELRPTRDRALILPEFVVRDMPLDEVLTKIADESVRADQEKKGISIANLTKPPQRTMKVTIDVRKKSVREILDLIAGTLGLWIRAEGDTIEVRNSANVLKKTRP
jgi:hypothetical protein